MSEEEKQIYVLYHRTSKSRLYMIDHSWAIYYYKVTSRTVRDTTVAQKFENVITKIFIKENST